VSLSGSKLVPAERSWASWLIWMGVIQRQAGRSLRDRYPNELDDTDKLQDHLMQAPVSNGPTKADTG
jgi:hypothetical protein